MKKSLVVKTLALLAFTFLGIQILILPAYVQREEREQREAKQILKKLLQLCGALRIPLFVLELDKLDHPEADKLYTELQERETVNFGVIKYERLNFLPRYRLHFETIGFKFFATKAFDHQAKSWVTSHIFLCNPGITVHIVIFATRTESMLWHGNVTWTDELENNCKVNKSHFFRHAGLFDRFSLRHLDGQIQTPSQPQEFLAALSESEFEDCNLGRAEEFFFKNPPDDAEESKKFQRNARQILARAKQHLDDLGIPFWLSSGTCLGWYRQCSIIPYSQDVDLGIFIKHYKPDLIPALEKGGFFLKNVFGKVSDSYELSFQAGDIKLDLFFFYEEDDHIWNGGTHHETGQKYKYTFPKFKMCWTIFLELKLRVPCPTGPYIEANYGENWMEPVREWEWNKSPLNVRENGVWPKEEWGEVIQVF